MHEKTRSMKVAWLFLAAVAMLLAAGLLAACQPATAEPQSADTDNSPIIIGVSLPLTGRFEDSGNAAKGGYEVWASMVNEAGGMLGRQVELRIVDNGSDPETAAADYEKLIGEDKVDLVVGTFSSLLVIPTSQVAADHGYAYVEPAGGAPDVFNRGLTNLFFAQPARSARQADPFALYALGLPEAERPKTFAVVALDDPFTLGVADRLTALLSEGGMELVLNTTYPEDATDFSDIAAQVAGLDPDLIVGASQVVDSIGQIQAYRTASYQPRFAYFTNGPTAPGAFQGALSTATEGIFSSVSWFPEAKGFQNADFVTKHAEMFGVTMGEIPEDAANAFTVGQILAQAVERIGSIDNAALIEELHRGTFDTVVGSLSFDETGAPQGNYMLLQWQGDNFVIVGPSDRAETDPVSPKPAW